MNWKAVWLFIIPICASLASRFILYGRVADEVEFGVSTFVLLLAMYPLNRYWARERTAGETRRGFLSPLTAHLLGSVVAAAVAAFGLLLLKSVGWY